MRWNRIWPIGLGLLGAACGDGTGPSGGGQATLALNLTTSVTTGTALMAPDTIRVGSDELVYDRIELVLREIEFERAEDNACEAQFGDDDDRCEKYEVGPFLLDLPLGPGVNRVFQVSVDTGTYESIEFDIHKPEDDDSTDQSFVASNPGFADVSIRVQGSFNGSSFVYTTDDGFEQELDLFPNLMVDSARDLAVTLKVDVATWFLVGGQLVDPALANKGGQFESEVETNIEQSLEAFEDSNGDGIDDDQEDDSSSAFARLG